jgi:transmembrane sensor
MHDPHEHPFLFRYITDQCSPDERVEVEEWLAAEPGREAYVSSLREIYGGLSAQPRAADRRSAWLRMRQRLAPVREVVRTPRRPSGFRFAAAASVLVAIGLYAGRVMTPRPPQQAAREFVTSAGMRDTVTLRDGTRLVLAPASRLHVPADFGRATRTVDLDGEALFTVVHDARHPFVVRTAVGAIQDVGTTFDVRAYAEDTLTRVAVAEGSVQLKSREVPTTLTANDVATLTAAGAVSVTHGVDAAALTDWSRGVLVFDNTPLSDVMRTLGRWYDFDTTPLAPSLGAQRVTFTAHAGAPGDAFAMIAAAIDVRIERDGRRVTVLSATGGR